MSLEIFYQFTENAIFKEQQLNGFLDHLFTLMASQLGIASALRDIYLDGDVALDLQGQKPKVYNVQLSVRNAGIFSVTRQQLKEIYWVERVEKEDKLLLTVAGIPVEIAVADYSCVIINGVPVRTLNSFN